MAAVSFTIRVPFPVAETPELARRRGMTSRDATTEWQPLNVRDTPEAVTHQQPGPSQLR
jgi:hypothetical protein